MLFSLLPSESSSVLFAVVNPFGNYSCQDYVELRSSDYPLHIDLVLLVIARICGGTHKLSTVEDSNGSYNINFRILCVLPIPGIPPTIPLLSILDLRRQIVAAFAVIIFCVFPTCNLV